MAYLTPSPKMQFFTANGIPLVGGKLYTYEAGTTTPLATYVDQVGSASNPNPTILDSRGEASVWLANSVLYDFVLKDAVDALIWTGTNVGDTGGSPSASTFKVQNFSGDGTTVAFVLTYEPPNENNTQIYINGAYQQKNTYSLAASTITFSQAPPLGVDNIEVMTIATLSFGYIDSSLVNYIPAGTGAVPTTVQDKLRESVSMFDFMTAAEIAAVKTNTYGAITSVHAAMQAAVNSISTTGAGPGPAGRVYLPAGTYRITSTITLPYGVSLSGDGALASVLWCYNCDGINFVQSVSDGNMQTVEDLGVIWKAGSNYTGILALAGAYPTSQNDGFTITRVKVGDDSVGGGFNIGINMANAWQSQITYCQIKNTNTAIIIGPNAVLVTVECNEIVHSSGGNGASANIGIDIIGVNTEANMISNNFIFGHATAIKMNQPWSTVIERNTIFTTAGTGIAQVGIDFSTVLEHLVIQNNIIESASTTGAIVIGVYGRALATDPLGTVVIQNNRFLEDNPVGTSVGLQINNPVATNQNRVIIQNNNFSGYTTYDIAAYNPSAITIQNNRLESALPVYSLYISGTIFPPCVVQNNWCVKDVQIEPTEVVQGKALVQYNYRNATYNAVDGLKANAAPTTGTWRQGDITWNALATASGFAGWICVTGGTPGTWKTFGAISA